MGAGAQRCMRQALADAGTDPADLSHVNAHGTSTRLNDLVEGRALAALFGGPTPPVTSGEGHDRSHDRRLGSGRGHRRPALAAASGWSRRWPAAPVDPDIGVDVVVDRPRPIGAGSVLSTSFGFGGHNAALVLAPG